MFDLDGAMSTEQAMPMSASMASPPAGHLGRSCMLASSFFLGCAHCANAHNTHVQRSSDVLNLFWSLLDLVFRRSLRCLHKNNDEVECCQEAIPRLALASRRTVVGGFNSDVEDGVLRPRI